MPRSPSASPSMPADGHRLRVQRAIREVPAEIDRIRAEHEPARARAAEAVVLESMILSALRAISAGIDYAAWASN